jgi:pimeloyl-ACP methyl ester carboxylesterase
VRAACGPPLPFDDIVSLIRQQLDELDIERPIVVGHSMSGELAMVYAAQHLTRPMTKHTGN